MVCHSQELNESLEQKTSHRTVYPPWWINSRQVVSWWDMEKFSAEEYVEIAFLLESQRTKFSASRLVGILRVGDSSSPQSEWFLENEDRESLIRGFQVLASRCETIGLSVSAANALTVVRGVSDDSLKFTNTWAKFEIKKALEILSYEMRDHLFLYIQQDKQKWYLVPQAGWEEVVKRFPSTITDIEEASRCFACDRYGGAIFHILLMIETGLLEVGKVLGDPDPKPGWNSVLKLVDRIVSTPYPQLTAIEKKYRPALEQIRPLMHSMENSWRNKISHAANKVTFLSGEISERMAKVIMASAQSFMHRVATDF